MTTNAPSFPTSNLYDGDYKTFAHSALDTCASNVPNFEITLYLVNKAHIIYVKIYMRTLNGRINGLFVCVEDTVSDTQVDCGPIDGNIEEDTKQCRGFGNVIKLKGKATSCELDLAEVEIFSCE